MKTQDEETHHQRPTISQEGQAPNTTDTRKLDLNDLSPWKPLYNSRPWSQGTSYSTHPAGRSWYNGPTEAGILLIQSDFHHPTPGIDPPSMLLQPHESLWYSSQKSSDVARCTTTLYKSHIMLNIFVRDSELSSYLFPIKGVPQSCLSQNSFSWWSHLLD